MGNAENKVQEAEYFLRQMRTSSGSEFMFNLSAFLTASRSILDVLLYDYGTQYGLFTLNDEIYPDDFRRLARGNSTATRFFEWWEGKRDGLAADSIGGFLSQKRHILVHRGRPAMAWSLILAETISFYSGLSFNPTSPAAGSATPNTLDVSLATQTPAVTAPRRSTTAYFADYPSASAIDICGKYLQMLCSIITEGRSGFP